MTEGRFKLIASIGRWSLLLLLAGLLIARRDFAHLNLGDLLRWSGLTPPAWSSRAYVTESVLIALLPFAAILAWNQFARAPGPHWRARFLNAFGWPVVFALSFCAYGFFHAVAGKINGGDNYLILRQSALAAYPLIFIYAQIFFSGEEKFTRQGALAGVGAALLCAVLDVFGKLGPRPVPETGEWMPIYGQQTLPLAILGLGYLLVSVRIGWIAALAFAGMALAGWRQGARPMQSVVPIGMAGALLSMLFFAAVTGIKNQRQTLLRVALCLSFFTVLGLSYRALKQKPRVPEQVGNEAVSEVKAWDVAQYSRLMSLYEKTELPADANKRASHRPPYAAVWDVEAHKLQTVFEATPTISVRNNMWRFLVWRRMLLEWRTNNTLLGRGVGKPWFYTALYETAFHYGDPREGLDPHNSYINTLHRYGALGFLLLMLIIFSALATACRALRFVKGDVTLEALTLYFFYTAVFAFFTVSLEGPAYSMPFWLSLGLLYARSKYLLANSRPASPVTN